MAYKAQFRPHQLLMDGQWVATDYKRGSRPPGLGWSNTMIMNFRPCITRDPAICAGI
jgi:hypothetical protein